MIEIGRLPVERWEDYKKLRLEALAHDPSAFGSSVEEEEAQSEDDWKRRIPNVLFAMSGDRPVGMIVFVTNSRIKTKHTAEIFGVYVKSSHRGKGIGSELLGEALSQIRKNRSVLKVSLSVNPEQEPAVELYRKAGFEVVGRARKDLKVGRRFYDLLYMEKFL